MKLELIRMNFWISKLSNNTKLLNDTQLLFYFPRKWLILFPDFIEIAVFLPRKWLILFPDFREIHRLLLMVLVTTEFAVIVCFAKMLRYCI